MRLVSVYKSYYVYLDPTDLMYVISPVRLELDDDTSNFPRARTNWEAVGYINRLCKRKRRRP